MKFAIVASNHISVQSTVYNIPKEKERLYYNLYIVNKDKTETCLKDQINCEI